MRPLYSLAVGLVLAAAAAGQDVAPRFGVLHNPAAPRRFGASIGYAF